MEAHAHQHHEMPTEGRALTGVAVSATLHCLTGCAIGEIAGVAIGTALGFSNLATILLAIALAFIFGYMLTSLPLLKAGLALAAVVPIALASDTLSIATMEVVDNLILLVIPGAMDAGLDTLLFWGSLAFALAVAFVLTVPVNRWLLARGKGHTAVHDTGIHGGPPTKLVGAAVIAAAVFGTSVLVAEAASDDGDMGHGDAMAVEESSGEAHGEHEAMTTAGALPGLSESSGGLRLDLDESELPQGRAAQLSFTVTSEDGAPVTEFDVEHEREMHLILVRRDLTGFQHLHPEISEDGVWSTRVNVPEPGSYRVFADFSHDGTAVTLGSDLAVDGDAHYAEMPAPTTSANAGDGYGVALDAAPGAGEEAELTFTVTNDGEPVDVEPYLGAAGHLVALREGDLAFLHVHPVGSSAGSGEITFMTEFPSPGAYRLFLQFRDEGEVRTAPFTLEVDR